METAPVQYAIVDGAVEEGLLDFLQEKILHTAAYFRRLYNQI